MKKIRAAAAAGFLTAVTRMAVAAGDSGTGSMGEMSVGAGTILLFVGALVLLGVVLWLLTKFLSK